MITRLSVEPLRMRDWEYHCNSRTYERRRAEHMGFIFGPVTLERLTTITDGTMRMRGTFTCVCGRVEHYHILVPSEPRPNDLDPALWLRNYGSFGREHLLQDGYSEDEVRRIERLGAEFDAEHGIHTALAPWQGSMRPYWDIIETADMTAIDWRNL